MTTDEFVKKWSDLGADRWLKSLLVEVTNGGGIDADDPSQAMLVASALIELRDIDDWPDINECVRAYLGTASSHDRLPKVLDQLDERLSAQLDEARRLTAGNPALAKPVLVVLAGAGFSKGFGLPITDELRDLAITVCRDPLPQGIGEILHLDTYPLSEFVRQPSRIPDVEYLLTIWVDYLDQLDQTKQRDVSSRARYHDFLENLCCHLFAKSKEAVTAHAGPFKAMVGWLRGAVHDYDVRFVTANYDIVLEQICREAGFRFRYLAREADPTVIPIRKLHGSLNWRAVLGAQGANADLEWLYRTDERGIAARDNLIDYWRGNSGDPPVIMPPAAAKNYEPVFLRTWHFALKDCQIAKKVLIVGYSFPPLDAFATVRLRDALKTGEKEITYVSPSKADCERVGSLLELPPAAIVEERWNLDHFYTVLEPCQAADA